MGSIRLPQSLASDCSRHYVVVYLVQVVCSAESIYVSWIESSAADSDADLRQQRHLATTKEIPPRRARPLGPVQSSSAVHVRAEYFVSVGGLSTAVRSSRRLLISVAGRDVCWAWLGGVL